MNHCTLRSRSPPWTYRRITKMYFCFRISIVTFSIIPFLSVSFFLTRGRFVSPRDREVNDGVLYTPPIVGMVSFPAFLFLLMPNSLLIAVLKYFDPNLSQKLASDLMLYNPLFRKVFFTTFYNNIINDPDMKEQAKVIRNGISLLLLFIIYLILYLRKTANSRF